jgi:hypothetical protein
VWADHALATSRQQPGTVFRKAVDALRFTLAHRGRAFAVPSKLVGVSAHQETVAQLVAHAAASPRGGVGLPLAVFEEAGAVVVSVVMDGEPRTLGRVQSKHAPWLAPLLAHGAEVVLIAVSGLGRESGPLGVNVAFTNVAVAVEAAREVSTATGSHPDDVVLYREADGSAALSVPHVIRHSPSGPEWGYGGSGPADCARSILLVFADESTADALYQRFKADVIARVPPQGTTIRAAFVRDWLARHAAQVPAEAPLRAAA